MIIAINNVQVGNKIINQKIELDDIVCLIGKNGSGKTSILRLISGTYMPSIGSISVNDTDYHLDIQKDKTKYFYYVKNLFFYLEDDNIFMNSDTSISDNFKYFMLLNNQNPKLFYDNFVQLCNEFQLNEPLNKEIRLLSSGSKRKVVIILALLTSKKYLIFDEPMNHLDEDSKNLFYKLIKKSKKSILIATHDLDWVKRSKVNSIEMGKII